MEIVWNKPNLIISSSVSFGHPDKYSYGILHEHLSGWRNLSKKIIFIKCNY